jgi:hypothetical protein
LAINVFFGDAIESRSVAPWIGEHRIETRAQPSRVAHETIKALVSLRGIRQRTSRKLFLDFQDMYRLHGAPLLLPSCCRTGSLRPVIGPTVSTAGRYSRNYYGASALLCPIT